MGQRGPVPNRSEDLARPRSRKGGEHTGSDITKGELRPVEIPEPDPDWHPISLMLWDGLIKSGQADFYQQSDWAFAYSICEDLSMYKKPLTDRNGEEYHKRSGQMLQTIYSAMERLLVTEGDRRRVRIELQEPQPEENPASLVVLDGYRQGLGITPSESETQ